MESAPNSYSKSQILNVRLAVVNHSEWEHTSLGSVISHEESEGRTETWGSEEISQKGPI